MFPPLWFWLLAAIYYLPTLFGLGSKNVDKFFILNTALGWTVIMWFVLLLAVWDESEWWRNG